MKKLILFTVLLTSLVAIPFSAFAMQPLADTALSKVTGQSGVSIAVDDVKLYQNIESLSYTDSDGTDGTAGTLSLGNLRTMIQANAITSLDASTGLPVSPGRDVQGTYATSGYDYTNTTISGVGDVFIAKALTIDVGTMPVLSAGATNNATIAAGGTAAPTTVAGVQIGLPTLELFQNAQSFDVTVSSAGAANDGASFGTLSLGNNTLAVLDGTLEIAPH